jgi:protein tyrosine/serine phosphatase
MGVELYNIPLTEHSLPKKEKIKTILEDVFDKAKRPIFVHCKSGSDRTGMICGLYKIDQLGTDTEEALGQLNFFTYGHSKILHPCMSQFISMWQGRGWFYEHYNY